jgi:hypothetical protein
MKRPDVHAQVDVLHASATNSMRSGGASGPLPLKAQL